MTSGPCENGLASWALTAAWLKVGVRLYSGLAATPGLTGLKCGKDKKKKKGRWIDRNSVAHAITASLARNSQSKAMMLQLTLVLRQQMPFHLESVFGSQAHKGLMCCSGLVSCMYFCFRTRMQLSV